MFVCVSAPAVCVYFSCLALRQPSAPEGDAARAVRLCVRTRALMHACAACVFQHIAVDAELPIPPSQFFSEFLADNAAYPFSEYHKCGTIVVQFRSALQ